MAVYIPAAALSQSREVLGGRWRDLPGAGRLKGNAISGCPSPSLRLRCPQAVSLPRAGPAVRVGGLLAAPQPRHAEGPRSGTELRPVPAGDASPAGLSPPCTVAGVWCLSLETLLLCCRRSESKVQTSLDISLFHLQKKGSVLAAARNVLSGRAAAFAVSLLEVDLLLE